MRIRDWSSDVCSSDLLAGLWIDLATVSAIQLASFLVLALLFRWTPLKMRLVPKATKLHRAARAAREQFLAQEVNHTKDRSGVLIFVPVAARYVQLRAAIGRASGGDGVCKYL